MFVGSGSPRWKGGHCAVFGDPMEVSRGNVWTHALVVIQRLLPGNAIETEILKKKCFTNGWQSGLVSHLGIFSGPWPLTGIRKCLLKSNFSLAKGHTLLVGNKMGPTQRGRNTENPVEPQVRLHIALARGLQGQAAQGQCDTLQQMDSLPHQIHFL